MNSKYLGFVSPRGASRYAGTDVTIDSNTYGFFCDNQGLAVHGRLRTGYGRVRQKYEHHPTTPGIPVPGGVRRCMTLKRARCTANRSCRQQSVVWFDWMRHFTLRNRRCELCPSTRVHHACVLVCTVIVVARRICRGPFPGWTRDIGDTQNGMVPILLMPYKILYNLWLICCNIIGRLFCKRKDGQDLAGPIL